jgi:hypothetical protein
VAWFTSTETYTCEIWSEAAPVEKENGNAARPGRGDVATVTLRRLNAGDTVELQDRLKMSMEDDNQDASVYLGTMRRLTVQKAVLDWSIPGPKPSPEAIAQLEPHVFEQIYAHCSIGTPTPGPQAAPNRAARRSAKDAQPS